MTPLISVCIPVYNGQRTLSRCLESVFSQTIYDQDKVEVIITDDQSTDHGEVIIRKYKDKYPIRFYQNPTNLGLTRNWKKALALGQGDIVTLLHQDDWYESVCLIEVIRTFQKYPDAILVALSEMRQKARINEMVAVSREQVGVFTGKEYFFNQLQFYDAPAPSATFLRREALWKLETLYDPVFKYGSELDLYIRLARLNPMSLFIHSDRPYIYRGVGATRFSQRFPGYRILDTSLMLSKYAQELSSDSDRSYSKNQAATLIGKDLLSLLMIRDIVQIREVFQNKCFQYWAIRNWRPIVVSFSKSIVNVSKQKIKKTIKNNG